MPKLLQRIDYFIKFLLKCLWWNFFNCSHYETLFVMTFASMNKQFWFQAYFCNIWFVFWGLDSYWFFLRTFIRIRSHLIVHTTARYRQKKNKNTPNYNRWSRQIWNVIAMSSKKSDWTSALIWSMNQSWNLNLDTHQMDPK